MNVIFLDFDGVLNSLDYFIEREPKVLELYKDKNYVNDISLRFKRLMLDIDINKVKLLKEIALETNSYVVVISSWKNFGLFPSVRDKLVEMGIPIIGITKGSGENRGAEIKNYLNENMIEKYIILDDEIFHDYDDELIFHLVKTSFTQGGLTNNHKIKAVKMLMKK